MKDSSFLVSNDCPLKLQNYV